MNTQQHLWKRSTDQEGAEFITFCGQLRNLFNPEHMVYPDAGPRPVCYGCYMSRVGEMRDRERAADQREGVKTAWLYVDIRFLDRLTGLTRFAHNQSVEVVTAAPNQVLFQDEASGCHRMVPLQLIEEIRPVRRG